MKAPIDALLETVEWTEVEQPEEGSSVDDLPYATHSGELRIGDNPPLRCYRLSNGQAVFNADDLRAFFESF